VAVLLLDDVLPWGLLVGGVALALLLSILLPILGFGALLALFSSPKKRHPR
jgi:hypothetical protein